jgi:hypothetical protein
VALVRTDVSEELSASFIRVKRIGELGATLAVASNRRMQHHIFDYFLVRIFVILLTIILLNDMSYTNVIELEDK